MVIKTALIALAVLVAVYYVFIHEPKPELSFDQYHKELFVISGSRINRDKLELVVKGNKWGVITKNGHWVEIATPYELYYNSHYSVVLEPKGTLAMVSNNRLKRSEMRWFDGEWKHQDSTTGEWLQYADPLDFDDR